MKKFSKKKINLVLISCLLLVMLFSSTAFAGTNRQFWDLDIRAWGGESVLTARNKETANDYSWVKVTSMKSVGKVTVGFRADTWYYGGNATVSVGVNTNQWIKCTYGGLSGSGIGWPIYLYARNYYTNSGTGSIDGWVDYE